jgi:hypothetical protein
MTDLRVERSNNARLTKKGAYCLSKREWAFQGDKPDYDHIAYITREQAVAAVSTGLAYTLDDELRQYWKAALND